MLQVIVMDCDTALKNFVAKNVPTSSSSTLLYWYHIIIKVDEANPKP